MSAIDPQTANAASQHWQQTLGSGTDETVQLAQAAYDAGNTAQFEQLMQRLPMMELKNGRIQPRPDHFWRNNLIGTGLAIGGLGLTGALMGPGAGALTATTSGAGGTLPASGFVGATGMATPTVAGANLAGGATTAAAGGGAMNKVLQWAKPALAGASLIGGATQQGGQGDMSPELQRILDMQAKRMESQNPLFEAVTQQAFNRLPASATQGMTQPSLAGSASQVPASVPNANTPPGLQNLLRQQEIRMRTQDPVLDAIQKLAQMRMGRG